MFLENSHRDTCFCADPLESGPNNLSGQPSQPRTYPGQRKHFARASFVSRLRLVVPGAPNNPVGELYATPACQPAFAANRFAGNFARPYPVLVIHALAEWLMQS